MTDRTIAPTPAPRRRSRWKTGLVGLLVVLALIAVGLAVWEPLSVDARAAPAPMTHDVRIVRDDHGVPHIFGATDADVSFGIAYAHSEDDFSTLQEVVAMTRSRLGAATGAEGAKVDYAAKLLDTDGTVARHYDALPADVRALLDGYARGMNLYADRHPEEIRLARLFPVNGRDIAAGFALRSPFFFGLDSVIGKLVAGLGVVGGQKADRFAVGIGMIPRGEVGLIFANVGAGIHVNGEAVIVPNVYMAIVLMVMVSTVITPPWLSVRLGTLKKREAAAATGPTDET